MNDKNNESTPSKLVSSLTRVVTSDAKRSVLFSTAMAISGACLGPFLDSFHSAFGVLQYDNPITAVLWGSKEHPALITAWWVPELFGLAGFLIGWLYIWLDAYYNSTRVVDNGAGEIQSKSVPLIFLGISIFTFQYWVSGIMYTYGFDRTAILNAMAVWAAVGFLGLDGSMAGLWTSLATAIGGPLIEVFLISSLTIGGYHYTDPGETGFFPLWIAPVYFLGGPANGNLARGFWNALTPSPPSSSTLKDRKNNPLATHSDNVPDAKNPKSCAVCNDTRTVSCPNCSGNGGYVTYGKAVRCNCCNGRGLVICRACFSNYDEDPNDIEAIRDFIAQFPDKTALRP